MDPASTSEAVSGALTWIPTLALALSLAACAGLRAWLPMLIAGLLARFEVMRLGDDYTFISSTPALVCFGVATVIEIAGDKIPAVDHALDAVSTVVRPAVGTLLAAAVMWQVSDPLWALVLGLLIGAPTAAVPHVAKAATRGASTALTAGIANPVLSVIEDLTAALGALLAVLVPILIAIVVVVLLGATGWIVWRWRRRGGVPPAPAG